MKRVALITGANKGIGFECARQLAGLGYTTILTARSEKRGKQAVKKLEKEGLEVEFLLLDVSDPKSIESVYKQVQKKFGRLDVLINNAGILLDKPFGSSDPFKVRLKDLEKTLSVNTVGPFVLCQKFIPLMKKKKYGRIVNVSSGWGQLKTMGAQSPTYSISKAALNAVTGIFADSLESSNVLINSISPGWVQTDMGGSNAERTPEEAVKSIIWAATLPAEGPSGSFLSGRRRLDW